MEPLRVSSELQLGALRKGAAQVLSVWDELKSSGKRLSKVWKASLKALVLHGFCLTSFPDFSQWTMSQRDPSFPALLLILVLYDSSRTK